MRLTIFAWAFVLAFAFSCPLPAQDCCECCEVVRCSGIPNTPDSPWTRGRFWLRQTGHFGLFYNCDCEERKRCSPFLCWRPSDSPWPGQRLRDCIYCDIKNIKQRILDGSASCCGDRKSRQPCKSAHCQCCK